MLDMSNPAGTSVDELFSLFAEIPWPTMLLAADGQVLALNQAVSDLLYGDAGAMIGNSFERIVPRHARRRLRAIISGASTDGARPLLATELSIAGQPSVPVEIEARAAPNDPLGRVILVLHRISIAHRHTQLLLALNRLAPQLLIARSADEVFRQAAQALEPFGLGLAIWQPDPMRPLLRLAYFTLGSSIASYMLRSMGIELSSYRIPRTTPGYKQALAERRAMYWTNIAAVLRHIMPIPIAEVCQQFLRLQGIQGLIIAPIIASGQEHGVLLVYSGILKEADTPFIESLAHQIAAVLTQLDLDREMKLQFQRLESLATTARAVTTLGSLDDVLRVICEQAQSLLIAEHAAVFLPDGDDFLRCVMATGMHTDIMGMRLPYTQSIVGHVFTSGQGMLLAESFEAPGIYKPAFQVSPSRSALFQPIIHQDAVLGVVVVNHLQPARFKQSDLDYLARYAEYAAVAIANAQMHAALVQSENEQRRLYREAEGMRSYLKTLIDHTPDILFIIGQDMAMHALNPHQLASTGYAPSEVEGRSFIDFISPHLHSEMLERWTKILSGQAQTFETTIHRANGRSLHTLLSAALIPEYGEVFAIVKNVTAQKHFEAQLRQNETLAALGRVVAGVAHELNNPLMAILGLAQLQLMEPLPPALREDIESIEQATLRASRIVHHLQIFVQTTAFELELLDLARLLEDTLRQLAAELVANSIDVALDLTSTLPYIHTNGKLLQLALFHIIQNALLAVAQNPPGTPRSLSVRGTAVDQAVHLVVADCGPGIAPEYVTRVFEPFFTLRPIGESVGLGLSLAYAIVQRHGGRIGIESDYGKGTRVMIELPIAGPAEVSD
jgi:PAS domain S-box-containing protein